MFKTKRTAVTGAADPYIFLGAVILVIGSIVGAALWGYSYGHTKANNKWLEEEQRYQSQVVELQEKIRTTETEFNEKVSTLNDTITRNKAEYQNALDRAGVEFANRLRKSEGRAKTYADMSQAGEVERATLADHTAKLDQSLEEGRHLVRELRETLGQRDREIMMLGEHIQNVYQLINNTGNSNGTTDSGNS